MNPDPIDVGMRIYQPLMIRLSKHVKTEKELTEIGRMIDILVGSAQVTAVEQGLQPSAAEYRALIKQKLESLGLMPPPEPAHHGN